MFSFVAAVQLRTTLQQALYEDKEPRSPMQRVVKFD